MRNIDKHTVPIYPHARNKCYGGLTLRGLIERVAKDSLFNGHFCLWLMDNDIDWIYQRRSSMESAVQDYKGILAELFKGVHLGG